LQIIAGKEPPRLVVLLKNLPTLLKVTISTPRRINTFTSLVLQNCHYHPNGHHIGRVQMILGLLYKAKKKRVLAGRRGARGAGKINCLPLCRIDRAGSRHKTRRVRDADLVTGGRIGRWCNSISRRAQLRCPLHAPSRRSLAICAAGVALLPSQLINSAEAPAAATNCRERSMP
jgi:hypothetical protein